LPEKLPVFDHLPDGISDIFPAGNNSVKTMVHELGGGAKITL
jgi:hypothetical protein